MFNSERFIISEERCWLEQDGTERLKLTGVIMLDVGVNPVEVIRVSNPRLERTFEGVSITMPSMLVEGVFAASF